MASESLLESYENCVLCPRHCGVDRRRSSHSLRTGFCKETDRLRVAYVGPHFGEEPPISGRSGSGTVFLAGCSLRCSFCQNYQISLQELGDLVSLEQLISSIEQMIRFSHVHNVNFVTPDHFFPHVFCLVSILREEGFCLPFVFNLSGYQSVETLKIAEDYADIYLPDYKYADASLAAKLSKCRDYPKVALDAITEMVKQKGFLDVCSTGAAVARKGVLVRHLILPGNIENSIQALTSLFVEFGEELPLSLMSQYHPTRAHTDKNLNHFLSRDEFYRVYAYIMELGFKNLFVQFPEMEPHCQSAHSRFLARFSPGKTI